MKTVVFPGSFDPVTLGHEDLVRRASKLYDKVIVAIGVNSTKQGLFSIEQRKMWLEKTFEDLNNVEVMDYTGLTVDLCHKVGAEVILRGIRNTTDFEFEKTIAYMNGEMAAEIETVVLFTNPAYGSINSSVVREIFKNGGDTSGFIPKKVDLNA